MRGAALVEVLAVGLLMCAIAVCEATSSLEATLPAGNNSTPRGNVTCLLDPLRHISAEEAARQGLDFTKQQLTTPSIIFSVVLLSVCLVVTFAGKILFKPMIFLAGFGLASSFTFVGLNEVFNYTHFSNCLLLDILPATIGLIAGCLALCLINVAFFLIGGCLGGVTGYYLWLLLHSLHVSIGNVPDIDNHGALFWICLCCGIVIGGLLALKLEHGIIAISTAVSGAAGVVLAGNMMLGQVDKRFTPQALSLDQNHLPYALVQLGCWALFALLGTICQYKCCSSKRTANNGASNYGGHSEHYQPIPIQSSRSSYY